MSAKTPLPFVSVTWLDAWKGATLEVTVKDVDEHHKPATMVTVGWLVRDNEKGITLANERCLDEGDEGYRGTSFIPRAMVQVVAPFPPKRASPRRAPPSPV